MRFAMIIFLLCLVLSFVCESTVGSLITSGNSRTSTVTAASSAAGQRKMTRRQLRLEPERAQLNLEASDLALHGGGRRAARKRARSDRARRVQRLEDLRGELGVDGA